MSARTQVPAFCAAVALLAACSSSSPPLCEPEITIERYPVVVVQAVRIPALPPLELEAIPTIPPASAGAEALKTWALEVNRVARANRAKRAARIRALEVQVAAVNAYADLQPTPTPTPAPD